MPQFACRALAVLLLGVPALASRGFGQATGVPVRGAGMGQGATLGIDFGVGRLEGGGEKSRAVAASATAGLGPLGVMAGIGKSWIDPDTGPTRDQSTLMLGASLTIFGGPLVPLKVSWQAGVDKALDDTGSGKPWRGHVGVGAALTIPAAVVSIRPWIAPRLDYLKDQPVSGPRVKGSLSAGIDLGMLNGLGLRVGYDSRIGWDNGNRRASGISIGASYHFR